MVVPPDVYKTCMLCESQCIRTILGRSDDPGRVRLAQNMLDCLTAQVLQQDESASRKGIMEEYDELFALERRERKQVRKKQLFGVKTQVVCTCSDSGTEARYCRCHLVVQRPRLMSLGPPRRKKKLFNPPGSVSYDEGDGDELWSQPTQQVEKTSQNTQQPGSQAGETQVSQVNQINEETEKKVGQFTEQTEKNADHNIEQTKKEHTPPSIYRGDHVQG